MVAAATSTWLEHGHNPTARSVRRPREVPCDRVQAKSWLGASSCAWSGTRRNSRHTRHAADLMLGILVPTAQLTLDHTDDGCCCCRLHTCHIIISPSLRAVQQLQQHCISPYVHIVCGVQSAVALDDAPPVDCRTAAQHHGCTQARVSPAQDLSVPLSSRFSACDTSLSSSSAVGTRHLGRQTSRPAGSWGLFEYSQTASQPDSQNGHRSHRSS